MKVRLPYEYHPRSYHRRIYAAHQQGYRHMLLVMHRRSGKTESIVSYIPQPMLKRKANYAHIFPELKQARDIVWDGIGNLGVRYIDHFPAPMLAMPPNKSELKLTLRDPKNMRQPGSTYQLKGTDKNVNALVGGGTAGIVWDEYSLQNPLARDYAYPILAENNGWEIVIFTPRGENHAYDLYNYACASPDWYVEYLTVDDTRRDGPGEDKGPVVTDEAIEAHRQELLARGQEDADAIIEQEYYLSWHTPVPGAIYGKEMRWLEGAGRITSVPYDPSLPTYTAWDLGRSDMNSIWFFQPAGSEIRFIDYMEDTNVAMAPTPEEPDSWITRVRARPYTYDHSKLSPPLTRHKFERHYGPHDLEVHEYSYNKTRVGIAMEHGFRFTVLRHPGPGGLADGHASVRRLLRRSVFDAEKCKRGLSALRSYHRAWDAEKQAYSDNPVHDWASHGADAMRYAAVGLMPVIKIPDPQPRKGSFLWTVKNIDKLRAGQAI